MKKVQINQAKTEIDWSKPMWVQCIDDNSLIILTTGEHKNLRFEGTAMPCKAYKDGKHFNQWLKGAFQPLVGEIQFTISNANDEK